MSDKCHKCIFADEEHDMGATFPVCIRGCAMNNASEIMNEQQCFSLKDLDIDGNDILALGVEAGPMVGKILKHLLDKVIDDKIENEHEALVQEAKDFCNNWSGMI